MSRKEIATLGLGWFWGPDARFGLLDGVVITKVGYSGGKKDNPTYESLGDHTEVLQIDYNSEEISYERILELFFEYHNPTRQSMTKQYMSVIFYHDDDQYKKAIEVRDRVEQERNIEILTEIMPYEKFYLAEFYHQKYYLQGFDYAMEILKERFPTPQEFLESPEVTKLNGKIVSMTEQEFIQELKGI